MDDVFLKLLRYVIDHNQQNEGSEWLEANTSALEINYKDLFINIGKIQTAFLLRNRLRSARGETADICEYPRCVMREIDGRRINCKSLFA